MRYLCANSCINPNIFFLLFIALDEQSRRVETVELIVKKNDQILFTKEFDDFYELEMYTSDLKNWTELTDYCSSYDIGLRLTGKCHSKATVIEWGPLFNEQFVFL